MKADHSWSRLANTGIEHPQRTVVRLDSEPGDLPRHGPKLKTTAPLSQKPNSSWSPLYGMLKDRFGVVWVLDVLAD